MRFGTGVNIVKLCDSLGAKTFQIEDPKEISNVLKKAIAFVEAGSTSVVDVRTKRVNASLHSLWE